MNDLIDALTILSRYLEDEYSRKYPTHCDHDVLCVPGVDPSEVSDEDKAELKRLGFEQSSEFDGFQSYRFGSC